jgi:hypothetical protein
MFLAADGTVYASPWSTAPLTEQQMQVLHCTMPKSIGQVWSVENSMEQSSRGLTDNSLDNSNGGSKQWSRGCGKTRGRKLQWSVSTYYARIFLEEQNEIIKLYGDVDWFSAHWKPRGVTNCKRCSGHYRGRTGGHRSHENVTRTEPPILACQKVVFNFFLVLEICDENFLQLLISSSPLVPYISFGNKLLCP